MSTSLETALSLMPKELADFLSKKLEFLQQKNPEIDLWDLGLLCNLCYNKGKEAGRLEEKVTVGMLMQEYLDAAQVRHDE